MMDYDTRLCHMPASRIWHGNPHRTFISKIFWVKFLFSDFYLKKDTPHKLLKCRDREGEVCFYHDVLHIPRRLQRSTVL